MKTSTTFRSGLLFILLSASLSSCAKVLQNLSHCDGKVQCQEGSADSSLNALLAAIGLTAASGIDPGPAPAPLPAGSTSGTAITASAGGQVALGSEVVLTVPAQSLPSDATIGILKEAQIPQGDLRGFKATGQAYRFSPAGTQFSISNPATVRISYDPAALSGQGVDPRTLQLMYYDEEYGRYDAVVATVDTNAHVLTGEIEHFTLYTVVAKDAVPGNHPPIVNLINPIPNPIRVGAPVYVRVTAYDTDPGGSVAGVRLQYKSRTAASWTTAWMQKEARVDALNSYFYQIPETYLKLADMGPGNDISFRVDASDNLGGTSPTTATGFNVTRRYVAGTATVTPASQDITAGAARHFVMQGQDDLGATFDMVPTETSLGETDPEKVRGVLTPPYAIGTRFDARHTGSDTLTLSAGTISATAHINVLIGDLKRIVLYDANTDLKLVPFTGTTNIAEGMSFQFDALGIDEYDNKILVNPTWNAEASLGTINQHGLLYTLDGLGFGKVQASVGAITATQWVQVVGRKWGQVGDRVNTYGFEALHDVGADHTYYQETTRGTGITYSGNRLFTSWRGNRTVYTSHWECESLICLFPWGGGYGHYTFQYSHDVLTVAAPSWNSIGEVLGQTDPNSSFTGSQAQADSIADFQGQPAVAWTTGTKVSVSRYPGTGSSWTSLGSINVDSARTAVEPSIAAEGANLYAAFSEANASGNRIVYVKRWNSSWTQLGGPLNANGASTAGRPAIAMAGATPFVAFLEEATPGAGVFQAVVKKWDGTDWVQVGGILNVDAAQNVACISLIVNGGHPVVAFTETDGLAYQTYVKRWTGSTWAMVGTGTVNPDPSHDAQIGVNLAANPRGTIYVAFAQAGPISYVRHFNEATASWVTDDMAINGGLPRIAFDGYTPHLINMAQSTYAANVYALQ